MEHRENRISVREFTVEAPAELEFTVLAGSEGLDTRFITSERIQKLGLALGGFTSYIHRGRVQMIGMSEIQYLATMPPAEHRQALFQLSSERVTCILLSKGIAPPKDLVDHCNASQIPLIGTPVVSSKAISLITDFLQHKLAHRTILHGVLLEMFGIGVFIVGESGIGKSECALDLVSRQHRLVSDDAVQIRRIGGKLYGDSPELTYGHLEIRGLGIISLRDLFGIASICDRISLDLVIELKKWADADQIERIGLDIQRTPVHGVDLPRFTLPVSPGRNLATLVETAVKLFLLREAGSDPARDLIERHDKKVNNATLRG